MANILRYVEDIEPIAKLTDLVEAIKDVRPLIEDISNFVIEYSSRDVLGILIPHLQRISLSHFLDRRCSLFHIFGIS